MTSTSPRSRWLAPCLCLALLASCAHRPARFADRAPITVVADDAPIAQPGRRELNWDWYISDVYLRRSLLDALDPNRPEDAGDVNSFDEVPHSSWYQPEGPELALLDPPLLDEGPPMLPLTLFPDVPRASDDGLCVVDARGVRYELRRDGGGRPEMRTSAAAISSRLIRAVGLLAPEVHIVFLSLENFAVPKGRPEAVPPTLRRFLQSGPPSVDGLYRMSATRWPVGVDAGISDAFDVRGDDPNDVVPHRNRRTLRALKVLGAWLAISSINPRKTRDAYVGQPGEGHLRHYIVGLEDTLGAGSIVGAQKKEGLRTDLGGGPGFNFLTFGLWPGSDGTPTQTTLLAVGNIDENVDPGGFKASPPYAPIAHVRAADGYWAAKRIAAIPVRTILEAVQSASIRDLTATRRLVEVLIVRRHLVVKHWYSQVTPAEVERVHGRFVVLSDDAVSRGIAPIGTTRYHAWVLDDGGAELVRFPPYELPAASFGFEIPANVLANRDRLVLRVQAEVDGQMRPRVCDVHLRPLPDAVRVIGVRH